MIGVDVNQLVEDGGTTEAAAATSEQKNVAEPQKAAREAASSATGDSAEKDSAPTNDVSISTSPAPPPPPSPHPSVRIRRLVEEDGEELRDLFANDVYTFSEWAWPILLRHVILVDPLAPFLFLLLFLLAYAYASSWATALVLTLSFLLLVWIQALSYFLFDQNLSGNQPEVMMMTGHLWNARSRSAYWVAVVDEGIDDGGREEGAERIVGAIAILESAKVDKNEAELLRMAVSRHSRRLGVASLLMSTAIEFCREEGFASIILDKCNVQEAGQRLYEAFQFHHAYEVAMWTTKVWFLPYNNIYYRKRLKESSGTKKDD